MRVCRRDLRSIKPRTLKGHRGHNGSYEAKKEKRHSLAARLPVSSSMVSECPGGQEALAKGNVVTVVDAVEPATGATSLLGGAALRVA